MTTAPHLHIVGKSFYSCQRRALNTRKTKRLGPRRGEARLPHTGSKGKTTTPKKIKQNKTMCQNSKQ